MLTRSRAKASKQPMFIDDNWNDAYIQTKDEQIDAMLAADASERPWDELEEEHSDQSSDSLDDSHDDVWRSDSDESEDHADDWLVPPGDPWPAPSWSQQWLASGSWLQNVFWTLAGVSVAPLLLYVSVPHHTEQQWPLQSPRLAGTLLKVLLNVWTLTAAAMALYGASCSSAPLTLSAVANWRQVQVEPFGECVERLLAEGRGVLLLLKEVLAAGLGALTAPLGQADDSLWTLVRSVDVSVVRQLAVAIAGVLVTGTCFYRLWAKVLVLLLAGSVLVLNVMTDLKVQQRAAVEIFSLDPTFAFVNESIFVAIDGQNLEEGGSVAWAPYWGGLQLKQAQLCSKHYPQQLSNGGVLVTFGQVNEYIPCYLSATETAAAVIVDGEIQPSEAFQCFESNRLRVKDQKSVPGWSLTQHEHEEAIPTEKQEL